MRPVTAILVLACALVANAASIYDTNSVLETPRINSGDELLTNIMSDCFSADAMMPCLKGKVLTYLDSTLGLQSEQGRAFAPENVDKVIFDRVGRILATNQFSVQLPETFFGNAKVTMSGRRGFDMEIPEETQQARGLLKKKLLLPVLVLMKLKMKLLMPIFVALIGLKAMKALILSKLAITLVLGFLIVQLVKKTGLGLPMSMSPMMPAPPAPEPPMPAYGVPSTTSSYEPSSWEPSSGGPYSRVWDPSPSSSLAYSAYYPGSSSSSSSSSSSGSSAIVSPSSSSSTGTTSITATSY